MGRRFDFRRILVLFAKPSVAWAWNTRYKYGAAMGHVGGE